MTDKIITAINLGSYQISVAIALLDENNKLEIKGTGFAPSRGIENGLVKDIPSTAEDIQHAINEAKNKAGYEIDNIFVGISGEHIISKDAIGRISLAIDNKPSEINESHITSAINDGRNSIKINTHNERYEVLDWIPQFFEIDEKHIIIANPIKMSGYSMKVHLKVILADSDQLRHIRKAFETAGIKKEPKIILGSLALTDVVTNDDERRLGCAIIDIGEGTSDITIYHQSYFMNYICVPKGGGIISTDLANGLRTPPLVAENLKIEYGNALPSTVKAEQQIDVEGVGGRPSVKRPLNWISQIIQTRVTDILDSCYKDILSEFPNLDRLNAGVVLTGGTAMLTNIQYMIEDKNSFNLPCKIAYPDCKMFSGSMHQLDIPRYASLIGLLYYACKKGNLNDYNKNKSINISKISKKIKDILNKMFDI